ncbi:MAG: hypothetical protein AB1651_18330 [Pseudomonadota bacterium]|jgi:hypothetical protein
MSRALRLLTRLAALPLAVVLLALLLVAGGVMLAGKVLFVLIAAAIEAVTSV